MVSLNCVTLVTKTPEMSTKPNSACHPLDTKRENYDRSIKYIQSEKDN